MGHQRSCEDEDVEGGCAVSSCARVRTFRRSAIVVSLVSACLALGAVCVMWSGLGQPLGGRSYPRHRLVLESVREADYKDDGENLMRKVDDITDWKLEWALKHNPMARDEIEHDAGHIGIHLQVEQLPADMRADVNPAGTVCSHLHRPALVRRLGKRAVPPAGRHYRLTLALHSAPSPQHRLTHRAIVAALTSRASRQSTPARTSTSSRAGTGTRKRASRSPPTPPPSRSSGTRWTTTSRRR
jgi:hypothetical protein